MVGSSQKVRKTDDDIYGGPLKIQTRYFYSMNNFIVSNECMVGIAESCSKNIKFLLIKSSLWINSILMECNWIGSDWFKKRP